MRGALRVDLDELRVVVPARGRLVAVVADLGQLVARRLFREWLALGSLHLLLVVVLLVVLVVLLGDFLQLRLPALLGLLLAAAHQVAHREPTTRVTGLIVHDLLLALEHDVFLRCETACLREHSACVVQVLHESHFVGLTI